MPSVKIVGFTRFIKKHILKDNSKTQALEATRERMRQK
jgi:hypothetical protein